jgi:hypothetical protein
LDIPRRFDPDFDGDFNIQHASVIHSLDGELLSAMNYLHRKLFCV